MLTKERSERDEERFRNWSPGQGTGQLTQAAPASKLLKRSLSFISESLGVTGEANCHPSRSMLERRRRKRYGARAPFWRP